MILDQIKHLCVVHSISLSELEKRTKISNGTIARWEKSSPRIDLVLKIADYFDVSLDYLVFGEEKEKTVANDGNGLSDKEKLILSIFNSLSEEQQWSIVREAQEKANSL